MTSQSLIQYHVDRLDHLMRTPPAADASKQEKVAYANKLRLYRLRLGRAQGRHTRAEWDAIVAETAGICVRCGYQHHAPEKPCKARVVALSDGGSDAASNLMPLCRACVKSRSAGENIHWLEHWRQHPETYLTSEPANG